MSRCPAALAAALVGLGVLACVQYGRADALTKHLDAVERRSELQATELQLLRAAVDHNRYPSRQAALTRLESGLSVERIGPEHVIATLPTTACDVGPMGVLVSADPRPEPDSDGKVQFRVRPRKVSLPGQVGLRAGDVVHSLTVNDETYSATGDDHGWAWDVFRELCFPGGSGNARITIEGERLVWSEQDSDGSRVSTGADALAITVDLVMKETGGRTSGS